jgi:hypothetical protein
MFKTIQICKCGALLNNHQFRHIAVPIDIKIYTDEFGPLFECDAKNFTQIIKFTNCIFPQCNGVKALHGTIFKHEFKEGEYKERKINITLPNDTKCRACDNTLENHSKIRHIFSYKLNILNKDNNDIVIISSTNGNILKNFDDMYLHTPKIEGKMAEKM